MSEPKLVRLIKERFFRCYFYKGKVELQKWSTTFPMSEKMAVTRTLNLTQESGIY
jgi:hypothetical protein